MVWISEPTAPKRFTYHNGTLRRVPMVHVPSLRSYLTEQAEAGGNQRN